MAFVVRLPAPTVLVFPLTVAGLTIGVKFDHVIAFRWGDTFLHTKNLLTWRCTWRWHHFVFLSRVHVHVQESKARCIASGTFKTG